MPWELHTMMVLVIWIVAISIISFFRDEILALMQRMTETAFKRIFWPLFIISGLFVLYRTTVTQSVLILQSWLHAGMIYVVEHVPFRVGAAFFVESMSVFLLTNIGVGIMYAVVRFMEWNHADAWFVRMYVLSWMISLILWIA